VAGISPIIGVDEEVKVSRTEFVKKLLVLLVMALLVMFLGYTLISLLVELVKGGVSPWVFAGLLVAAALLVLLFPYLKKRFGQPLWRRLPRIARLIILGLKIIGLVLLILVYVLLGFYFPILLVVVSADLALQNYHLSEKLRKIEQKDNESSQSA
jgi:hypothetical protein